MFTFDIFPYTNNTVIALTQHTNTPNVNIASDIIQAFRNTTALSCTLTFIRISFFGDDSQPLFFTGDTKKAGVEKPTRFEQMFPKEVSKPGK